MRSTYYLMSVSLQLFIYHKAIRCRKLPWWKFLFIIAVFVAKISNPLRRFSCLFREMVRPIWTSEWKKNKTNIINNADRFAKFIDDITQQTDTVSIFLTFERYNNKFGNEGRWWRYGCKRIWGSQWYVWTIVAPPQRCLFRRSVFRTISGFSTHLA